MHFPHLFLLGHVQGTSRLHCSLTEDVSGLGVIVASMTTSALEKPSTVDSLLLLAALVSLPDQPGRLVRIQFMLGMLYFQKAAFSS